MRTTRVRFDCLVDVAKILLIAFFRFRGYNQPVALMCGGDALKRSYQAFETFIRSESTEEEDRLFIFLIPRLRFASSGVRSVLGTELLNPNGITVTFSSRIENFLD